MSIDLLMMETPASPPAPTAPAPRPWCRLLLRSALVVFCLYLALLYLLALDQHYHWGLVPNQADREISALITQLGDASLTPGQHLAIMDQIVDWNSFAVPILINATANAPQPERDGAVQCLQEISLKYYGKDIASLGLDADKLNQWWISQQAESAKPPADRP
jgi:hypothetical protein